MARSRSVPFVLILSVMLAAAPLRAQVTGMIALSDCSDVDRTANAQGELVIEVPDRYLSGGAGFLFDLRVKGGLAAEGTDMSSDGLASRGDVPVEILNFSPRGYFVRITLPALAPGEPQRVALDAREYGVDLGAVIPLSVGDSLPLGLDRGIGLRISPGGTYAVNFGTSVRQYPQRDSGGSVTLAFAPLAELNATARGQGCSISGEVPEGDTAARWHGIVGYAVYRVPTPAGAPPGPAEFTAALTDGDPTTGFVGFVSLASFRLDVATDVTVDPTVNDLDPNDGAVLHDPDGRMYSGDEVILWTDAAEGPRANPARAPLPGVAYSYAVQPVAYGRLGMLTTCFTSNCILDGDHLRDLDGNGFDDAVDLDGIDDTSRAVEFISPQADPVEGAQTGLGLTYASQLLLSATMTVPPAPTTLRRSVAVTALSPLAPPLASLLPLDVGDDYLSPFATGDVDPDPAIMQGGSHPLVFYEVPGKDIRVTATGAMGSRFLRFTF